MKLNGDKLQERHIQGKRQSPTNSVMTETDRRRGQVEQKQMKEQIEGDENIDRDI
jgi:hypothetical protein